MIKFETIKLVNQVLKNLQQNLKSINTKIFNCQPVVEVAAVDFDGPPNRFVDFRSEIVA